MLLYRTWHLQRENMLDGDEGVGLKGPNHSAHLPARRLSAENGGTMSNIYYKTNRAETIK